jgi:hypothetical protein
MVTSSRMRVNDRRAKLGQGLAFAAAADSRNRRNSALRGERGRAEPAL